MEKLKRFLVALCILTVGILGFNVWVYAKAFTASTFTEDTMVYEHLTGGTGLYYKVEILEEEPLEYWNLTEPDEYILMAINNPDKWIKISPENQSKTTFLHDYPQGMDYFRYEDTYYDVRIVFVDDFELLDRTVQVSALILIPAWSIFTAMTFYTYEKKHKNSKKFKEEERAEMHA